jgi:hypothetical protein
MGHPLSIRLDDDTQATLEDAAKARGIGLATYLRELAAKEARRLRRERIRAQSRAVGAYVASSPKGRRFTPIGGLPPPTASPGESFGKSDGGSDRPRGLARRPPASLTRN